LSNIIVLSFESKASELRTRPDVVVATPGRLLDHITNSQGVDLDDLEFLVLDEADRLLDLGFQDEVHEIVKSCPTERQTMLFSATMSTKVDELIKLSLKRPVRIQATEKKKGVDAIPSTAGVEVAPRLEQEFIRIRPGNEGVNREGMLLALLTRTFKSRVIVFFDTKSAAHRLMIVCGLCGIKCAELHGNLTQVQRLEALEAFREGSVDVLLATDLAARGLDIPGVEAVINFEMPSQVDTYVHRIGRTARAGRGGKSCTLIGEGRRYLMKEVIKDAEEKSRRAASGSKTQDSSLSGVIRSRTIPPPVIAHFVAKINSLENHVKDVLDAEAVSRMDRIAEMEAMRARNIIEHNTEIKNRPQKEWFASNKQRLSTKEAAAEKKRLIDEKAYTSTHRMSRKKRRAQEAHAAMEEARQEARDEAEESGKKPKKVLSDGAMKGSAKVAKKREMQLERERAERSIHDDDMRRERKLKQKRQKTSGDALGDGGLFSEEKVSFAKKPKKEAADAPIKSR
jgi:ATP-dependent RNA helicase DDX27